MMSSRHRPVFLMRQCRLWSVVVCILHATNCAIADESADDAWTHFPPVNQFTSIAVDDDVLWIGTVNGGVVEWNTTDDSSRTYSQGVHCLPSNAIADITVAGDGSVWAATTLGMARRPPDADFETPWEAFDSSNSPLPDANFTAVETASDGSIWIGTFDAGLFHRDNDGNWTSFNTDNSPLSDPFVTSLAFDFQDNLWIGVWSAGVDRFNGGSWTNFSPANTFPGGTSAPNCIDVNIPSLPPDELGLISVFVEVIGVDPNTGDVWFTNDDDGPCLLNGTSRFDGENWSTYTQENSNALQDQHAALVRDANGDLLFISLGTMERFDGNDWLPADGDGNFVPGSDMIMVGDDLWIAGAEALFRISDGAADSFVPSGPADSAVFDVATITTQLPNEPPMKNEAIAWIATRSGVQRFDGENWLTFTAENSGIGSTKTWSVAQDLDGSLWFGSGFNHGVSRFDGKQWQTWTFDDGLVGNRIPEIEVHPQTGEKWMISDFGNISVTLDGSGFTNFMSASSPLPGSARDIDFAEDGSVWIATDSGVAHVVNSTWTIHDESTGLPDNFTDGLAIDHDGNVWVGQMTGVAMFDTRSWTFMQPLPDLPDSVNRVTEIDVAANGDIWVALLNFGAARYDGSTWTHYDEIDDGIVSNKVQSFDVNAEGEVWLATFNGVSIFAGPAPTTCPADLTGGENNVPDGVVNVIDLLVLLGGWGTNGSGAEIAEPFDIISIPDLLALLATWGPCE